MSEPKALFIVKKRSYEGENAIPIGVYYSALFLTNAAKEYGVTAQTSLIDSDDEIIPLAVAYKPTHVSIQALVIDSKTMVNLCRLFPHTLWNVRIHSKIPFLATDSVAFEYLHGYLDDVIPFVPNFQITTNNKETSKNLSEIFNVKVPYLPNIYLPEALNLTDETYKGQNKSIKKKDIIHVGCFGAPRVLKNQLLQAVAALRYGAENDKVIKFHINTAEGQSSEQQSVVKNLRDLFATQTNHELFEHAWIDHKSFANVVSTMDLGMQVSLSETFNFVTADFVNAGVPVVVSPEVSWMPSAFQADPTSTAEIIKTMSVALRGRTLHFHYIAKRALYRENQIAAEWWQAYLEGGQGKNFGP